MSPRIGLDSLNDCSQISEKLNFGKLATYLEMMVCKQEPSMVPIRKQKSNSEVNEQSYIPSLLYLTFYAVSQGHDSGEACEHTKLGHLGLIGLKIAQPSLAHDQAALA